MAKLVNANLDFNNTSRITNLPDGVGDQEPATVAQLNSAIGGLAPKDSCRVASVSNVNIASPGTTIDGVTMAANDRVLLKDQSTASQNGLYIWNGSAVAMTRSTDADTASELEAAVLVIEEGTVNAGTQWRQTAVNFTLGSGSVAFISMDSATPSASETTAGKLEIATQAETNTGTDDLRAVTPLKLATATGIPRSFSQLFGDGSATQYDITHNKGTKEVSVTVREVSDDSVVEVDWRALDVNTVRIQGLTAAPASNAYKATIFFGL